MAIPNLDIMNDEGIQSDLIYSNDMVHLKSESTLKLEERLGHVSRINLE